MSVYVLHIKLRAASLFLLCKVWESCFSSQASLCLWFLNREPCFFEREPCFFEAETLEGCNFSFFVPPCDLCEGRPLRFLF